MSLHCCCSYGEQSSLHNSVKACKLSEITAYPAGCLRQFHARLFIVATKNLVLRSYILSIVHEQLCACVWPNKPVARGQRIVLDIVLLCRRRHFK